jgi:DNA-directed RNA polymerase sigma subunit (sigma70/sigma32)
MASIRNPAGSGYRRDEVMVSTAVRRSRAHARQAKAHWKQERIACMLAQILSGRRRNAAIAEARALGVRLQEIGTAIGLTRERIRQICEEDNQTSHVRERPIRQSARSSQARQ